jgi:transposase
MPNYSRSLADRKPAASLADRKPPQSDADLKLTIGLDVHSKLTVWHAQNQDGTSAGQGEVATTAEGLQHMLAAVAAPSGTRVGLETGSQCQWVAHVLSAAAMEPVVIDAREVRAKARRVGQKCDRRDAFEICDGLRRGIFTTIVWMPPEPIQRLRRVLSRRSHFVRQRTAQVNAAKFVLRSAGISLGPLCLKTRRAWERLLADPRVASVRADLDRHARAWALMAQLVEEIEKELLEALAPFEREAALLQTAPGVGLITAATYLAVLGTPDRFETGAQVASYVGLTPSTHDSGARQRHGAITKRGSSPLRATLCEAAQHARLATHPLNPYFARVAAKSGYKRAVVAVAHRLACVLWAMWRKGEAFDAGQLNVEFDPQVKSKTVYYRIKKAPAAAAA